MVQLIIQVSIETHNTQTFIIHRAWIMFIFGREKVDEYDLILFLNTLSVRVPHILALCFIQYGLLYMFKDLMTRADTKNVHLRPEEKM